MAFVELLAEPQLPLFCNVHQSVGPKGANARHDVMLVQYLLKVYYDGGGAKLPGMAALKPDGIAGPVTHAYIRAFQEQGKAKGHNIHADGMVHRAQGTHGSLTGSQFTIIHLNNAFNGRRPALDRHVWCAADCPPDLREALVAASMPKGPPVVWTHGGGM